MIFHLVPKSEWDTLLPQRPYIPSTYTKDGFIHCSGDEATMLGVANRFYKETQGDVLLLVINEGKLTSELRWEGPVHPQTQTDESATVHVDGGPLNAQAMPPEVVAEIGAKANESVAPAQPAPSAPEPLFPHVYGPINRDAIVEIRQFVRDAQGNYTGTVPLLPATPASATPAPATPAPPALPEKPAPVVSDPANPLNLKSPSQMANELLEATDNFSEALKRYKDRVESHIDDLDKNIKRSLGD